MDLFVVNRFWGEGNHELIQNLEETDQIDKLLHRIEERKKQKHQKNASRSITMDKSKVDDLTEVSKGTQPITEDQNTKPKMQKKFTNVDESTSVDILKVNYDNNSNTNGVFCDEVLQESPINEDVCRKPEATTNFTVIGSETFKNRIKTNHRLPSWLENPVPIPVDLDKMNDSLEDYHQFLNQRLIQKLRDSGITHFFPVQEKVIPWLLKDNLRCHYHWPRDICVSAPTGSGKTLAFVLPIIQALMGRIIPEIRVLVVLPVVELAKQVGAVFRRYCSGTGLQVTVAVGGGTSFSTEHSLLISEGELVGCQTDILVTTPGRLVAHLRADSGCSIIKPLSSPAATGAISLSQLQFLVVDEADRVAEGSQNDWLSHLLHHLGRHGGLVGALPPSVSTIRNSTHHPRRPPQKLLFSATLSRDPERLCALSLFQPKLFSATAKRQEDGSAEKAEDQPVSYTTPKELSEEYLVAEGGEAKKPLLLLWLLQQRLQAVASAPKVLVFAGSRRSSCRLALLLSLVSWDINTTTIISSHLSADLSLQNRERVLQDFVEGRTNILVCSDALARGVDIPQVDLVISYDPPRHAKNHIHRIGRTGRAGRHGCAITILTPKQLSAFALMISGGSSMGNAKEITLDMGSLCNLNERYEKALESMEKTLQEEQEKLAVVSRKRKRKDGSRRGLPMATLEENKKSRQ